ncbi:MAG: OmpA family protein [Methyloceanibacter sp.]
MKPAGERRFALAAAVLVLSFAAQTASGQAEDPSAGQLIQSLQPKVKLRAFDPGQGEREAKQRALVNRLQNSKTRQITVEERQEIAEAVKDNDLPAVDLEVFFEFDSAAITPEATPILLKLGEALGSDKLKGSVFMVAGHTDGKGSDSYNLGLSTARANSVREFLIEKFHMEPKQLVAVGFGEEQLKNQDDPLADENRRVQVVNMAAKDVAAKAPPAEKGEPAPEAAPAPEAEPDDAPPPE